LEVYKDEALKVESGVACARVARFAARNGLCGAEFLAGIPGTMGGALAMNAGAFGAETWDRVSEVETVDRRGSVRTRKPAEFEIGYRHVQRPEGEWFLAAFLKLQTGDGDAALQEIQSLLEKRAATQPVGLPSCGSVFRNPAGDYAARLIEAAGLKDFHIGGACVSRKHANFIINTGAATAGEIEELINTVRDRVEEASGIRLQTEVHIVGEKELAT
jgi:UDP-N-acetylmuramate dehydrogenase